MNTLYFTPGACSIGIHVLLEEIGQPYEALRVDLMNGAQFKPEFTAINAKSKVPTLMRADGSVLTEYPAIAFWLAATNPAAGLMPATPDGQAQALQFTDHAVSTIHMQAFARMLRPGNFSPTESDAPAVKARGKELYEKGLGVMDKALAGKDYLCGDYSFADSALFYVSFWYAKRMESTLPDNVAAHYARMLARPAVQRTMAAEGLA
jgi:glutathione S-transferase